MFRDDMDQVRQRWQRLWAGQATDRPNLLIVAPAPGATVADKPHYTAGADGDFAPHVEQMLRYLDSHQFFGEAIPFYPLEFGPDHFSALLGAEMHYNPASGHTSWIVPMIEDYERAEIRFRPEGKWWRRTVEFIEACRDRWDDRIMIAAPSLVANLDCLAALRGVERLALDLVERPGQVQAALASVCRAYSEVVDALAEVLEWDRLGSVNRHGLYSRRIHVLQCDFSCMISPSMFRQFVVPSLRHEARQYDAVEYHLDGPGAIQHLPALAEIAELDVIQWVPGSGWGEGQDWTELFVRIDRLGLGQYLGGGDRGRMLRFWKEFQSRKLVFSCQVSSADEAARLLESF